mmetsp:Transcript_21748/g.40606  ORF Transcript_21748/g.40606 Transcript_21748/m.40606 type:complete len:87 (+) Transcript_21748:1655-1915(+)
MKSNGNKTQKVTTSSEVPQLFHHIVCLTSLKFESEHKRLVVIARSSLPKLSLLYRIDVLAHFVNPIRRTIPRVGKRTFPLMKSFIF